MPKPRVQWIDFCRVYVAFCVIVRHCDRYRGGINFLTDLFTYRSLIFFFFLMAGYFTHRAEPGRLFDWERSRRLLWPYLFWAALAMLLLVPMLNWQALCQGDYSCISFYTLRREMGFDCWAYWGLSNIPLWFLRTLIIISFFSPLLQRIPSRALWAVILLCFAGSDVLCYADMEAAERGGRIGVEWLPYRLYESVLAVGFYAGGLMLRRYADTGALTAWLREYALLPVLASLLLLPAVYFWRFDPPIMSSALVLLGVWTTMSIGCLCERWAPRFCHAVAKLGPAAFFVYVTHYILLKCFRVLLTGEYRGSLSQTEALWLPFAIFGISLGLFFLLKRFCPRFMRWAALLR